MDNRWPRGAGEACVRVSHDYARQVRHGDPVGGNGWKIFVGWCERGLTACPLVRGGEAECEDGRAGGFEREEWREA
jgi:hypothetical protein